ncbi:extracellular solute-binding protein [Microbacterium sp.]|uniref:ABC transporter substrate-binding protein n=1 Tax=Microbacterium sp. TaxID=51671 RepID=UPI00333E2082
MKSRRIPLASLAGAAVLGLALTGCGAGSAPEETGPVTISIGDVPGADQPELRTLVEDQVAAFEKKNPDIKIELSESKWDATGFQAMVAGGTMPTMLGVPFTEPATLMRNGQIADITDALDSVGFAGTLNPSVMQVVTDREKHVYGVPLDVYSVGLAYNRALFTAAGLDPDKGPKTWDDVRDYAKRIADKTGAAGYATYSIEHVGGWMTTAGAYSFGATLSDEDGSKATLDDAGMVGYLDLVNDMRWKDKSMGSRFLYGFNDLIQDFAAGKVGMFLSVSQHFPAAVQQFGMKPADYGFTAMPEHDGTQRTLLGGAVEVFNPRATPAQIKAGLKWVEFNNFRQYTDKDLAIETVKKNVDAGSLIGVPGLSPLDPAVRTKYESWVKEYYNVPVDQFRGYSEVMDDQELVPEPTGQPQQVYGELDTVLQKVLNEPDQDIRALLQAAQKSVNAKLSR